MEAGLHQQAIARLNIIVANAFTLVHDVEINSIHAQADATAEWTPDSTVTLKLTR
jgi:hypothetical protein